MKKIFLNISSFVKGISAEPSQNKNNKQMHSTKCGDKKNNKLKTLFPHHNNTTHLGHINPVID